MSPQPFVVALSTADGELQSWGFASRDVALAKVTAIWMQHPTATLEELIAPRQVTADERWFGHAPCLFVTTFEMCVI